MGGVPFSADEMAAHVHEFSAKHEQARDRWMYCLTRVQHRAIHRDGSPFVSFHNEGVPACARFLGLSASSARYRLQSIHRGGYDKAEAQWSRIPILKGMTVGLIQPWQIGHVYFARVQSHPHVLKIGFSRRVKARLEDIERSCGVTLSVIGPNLRVGTLADEQWWHYSLRKHRIAGEWFFDPKRQNRTLPDFLQPAEEEAA